jgi:GDPmannose 4,6-dehydratase
MRVDLRDLLERIELSFGDMSDPFDIADVIQHVQPDEIYNLASQSDVSSSWARAIETGDVTGLGAHRIFEAVRRFSPGSRVYHASSSEMFGEVRESPQNESTPFCPTSPYGAAKVYAHQLAAIYRRSFGLYVSCGILFNHESPRRGHNFVTRKITIALGNILKGKQDKLVLGNINSLRDWGHAKDYVEGMWRMLQTDVPDDYILSTNEYHSVREFVEKAFALKGFAIKWKGLGIDEIGYDENTGRELIFISEKYFRPAEVDELLGDSTRAQVELGWTPSHTFQELVAEMVELDCI